MCYPTIFALFYSVFESNFQVYFPGGGGVNSVGGFMVGGAYT